MIQQDIRKDRLKVFIQDARLLSDEEQKALPREKREAASGKTGMWIEVSCPDWSCSFDGERIILPAGGVSDRESRGVWLSLFCPEDQCELESGNDIP